MRSKTGRKIIATLRILTEGIMTRKELERRTGVSTSAMRKLLLKAQDENLVVAFDRGKLSRRRGKPGRGEFEKETGRPPRYYALSGEGLWFMRFDTQMMDTWKQVQTAYEDLREFSEFDSYANLQYAIQMHPILKEYRKPYYFMDQELQQVPLNPFIWGGPRDGEVENVYTELAKIIKESVRSEHIFSYYRVLEEAVSELEEILNRHKLLMRKMQKLPEIQEYRNKRTRIKK